MPNTIAIRPARNSDASALAGLAAQLGYPSTPGQVRRRLDTLTEKAAENEVFVAEAGGQVVGWVHVHIYRLLVDDPEAEIGGLVVDEQARGRGVGAALMQAAESWAKEKGCASVYLRSNVIRTQAHEFYKRLGYTIVKSQYAFRKALG